MTIYEKLSAIQAELKAPKSQYNSFGNFNYRSCEDILEAVKPLCKAQKAVLTLTDLLVNIGERYYIQATAYLRDMESKEFIEVSAFAREEDTKKGMDGSQVTGASSSYARKYALNGLFCIDDAKDSDYTNGIQPKEQKPAQRSTPQQKPQGVKLTCKDCGVEISDKIHDYSVKKFGAPYCMNCQKNHANH